MPDENGKVEVDDWAAAFAALDKKDQEDAEEPAGDGAIDGGADGGAAPDGVPPVPPAVAPADGDGPEAGAGEPGAPDGGDGEEGDEGAGLGDLGDVAEYRKAIEQQIRDQAINDIAREFIKRGVRHGSNGALGASLDDADICKRDEDGVPHFYNPETGQEFRGDNPRRQAMDWVEDYNKELARVFDDACMQYEQKLMQDYAPQIAVREFAPKYEKLDPVRKGMFERVIAPYEIKDGDGDVVGYSCDLDAALDVVNSQISWIQEYAKENGTKVQPTGPALDMKTSSGAVQAGDQPAPASLAEAMERQQDKLLEQFRNKR